METSSSTAEMRWLTLEVVGVGGTVGRNDDTGAPGPEMVTVGRLVVLVTADGVGNGALGTTVTPAATGRGTVGANDAGAVPADWMRTEIDADASLPGLSRTMYEPLIFTPPDFTRTWRRSADTDRPGPSTDTTLNSDCGPSGSLSFRNTANSETLFDRTVNTSSTALGAPALEARTVTDTLPVPEPPRPSSMLYWKETGALVVALVTLLGAVKRTRDPATTAFTSLDAVTDRKVTRSPSGSESLASTSNTVSPEPATTEYASGAATGGRLSTGTENIPRATVEVALAPRSSVTVYEKRTVPGS